MEKVDVYESDTKWGKMTYLLTDASFMRELLQGKIYDEDEIENCLKDIVNHSKVILDIGAHCGSHTILYCKFNPNVHVYSFEPQNLLCKLLSYNVKNMHVDHQVTIYNFALGNKTCDAAMSKEMTQLMFGTINDQILRNFGGVCIGEGGEPVQIKRLDDMNIQDIDFIKIDVEGFENYVISGGIETIKRCKPVIYFEYGHNFTFDEKYHYHCEDIFTQLDRVGYITVKINELNYLAFPNIKANNK